jgi:hypothetical protein
MNTKHKQKVHTANVETAASANTNAGGKRRGARPAPKRSPLARDWGPAILATFFVVGCGPDFDPASLVTDTRVVGARVEAAGTDNRASPAPGENASVTWLVTAPAEMPPIAWAFAACRPAGKEALGCGDAPFATFSGTSNPPLLPLAIPAADALGGADSVVAYGRICVNSTPVFDPGSGLPTCSDGKEGTTASLTIHLETNGDANHNPTADRGFLLDGQPWPATAAGGDPCADGPRIAAGSDDHEIAFATAGGDREAYTAVVGDPPVPTAKREALQTSLFTTAGKLKTPFVFVEAADARDETPVSVKWTAPRAGDVAANKVITFTFVVRDNRGGTDWTTRAACVTP